MLNTKPMPQNKSESMPQSLQQTYNPFGDSFEAGYMSRSCSPVPFTFAGSGGQGPGTAANSSKPNPQTYIVQAGDGPEKIANRFGVTVDALLQANGYRKSANAEENGRGIVINIATGAKKMFDPGDRLVIPSGNSSPQQGGGSAVKAAAAGVGIAGSKAGTTKSATMLPLPNDLPPGFAPKPNMTETRHVLSKSNFFPKETGNSLLIKDIAKEELAMLYKEAAWKGIKDGNVVLSNGQTWYINASTGKFHPVGGTGIINLTSAEMNALKGFNNALKEGREIALSALKKELLGRKLTISNDMMMAIERLAQKGGIPKDALLPYLAPSMKAEAAPSTDLVKEAQKLSKGKAFKIVKWGGRAVLMVAIAADLYEIYQADFAEKVIVEKAGAWAGSLGASAVAAKGAAPLLAGGPIGWIGYGVIVIGAGAIGYWAGGEAAETIYEWQWEKQEIKKSPGQK